MKLAEDILKKEENLLLQMSDYLSDNRMMKKDLIEEYCFMYGKNIDLENIIVDGSLLYYRKRLKEKAKNAKKNRNRVSNK